MRVAWNKKPRTPQVCRNCATTYYKVHESDKRSYCSLKCRKEGMSKRYQGAGAPGWKGGLTPFRRRIRNTKMHKNMQKLVFEVDNYTCSLCGRRGGNMEMHHIRTFAENGDIRYFVGNLVTLCNPCHNETKGRERIFENYFDNVRTNTLLECI
jgi:5-methylcytosine-specific restriction endonuclease McrA